MKKTIKNKITVWFAVVLVLISCAAMFVLHSVSKDILIRDQTANIQIAVMELLFHQEHIFMSEVFIESFLIQMEKSLTVAFQRN